MKNKILPNLFALVLIAAGCQKEGASNNSPVDGTATLTTAAASLITSTSAQLGGAITDTGSCTVTVHGIVIATTQNPTTANTVTDDAVLTGVGSFRVTATGLTPNTVYHARAYATNCKGTTYGNEITFTTGTITGPGGGPNPDDGYFKLMTGGVTYFSYDLLSTLSSTVFSEGDTRLAYVTYDASNKAFNLASQSSFILDVSQSFGYSFSYTNPDVNSAGTYSFGKAPIPEKNIEITLRTAAGPNDFVFNPGYNDYLNTGNFTRRLDPVSGCISTEITSVVNTLIITKWGNPGEFIEGTIGGTLYEIPKSSYNCENSTSKAFTVEFKLIRIE